jgi:hypothetical protein
VSHKRCAYATVPGVPRHYSTLVSIDISGFGSRSDDEVQLFIRDAMYRMLVQAFGDSNAGWAQSHHEDRGDGVFAVVPYFVPPARLIHPLTGYLSDSLRRHNKMVHDMAKIRLRMALHIGQVHFDSHGVAGEAAVHLFRLLEAPEFKQKFAVSSADLALVTSGRLYDYVVRHSRGAINPACYEPLDVSLKETQTQAWIHFPPVLTESFSGQFWAARQKPPACAVGEG